MSCAATRNVKVAHDNKFGDNKCGRDSGDCQLGVIRGGVQKIVSPPSCKIRLGTNSETSCVSTGKFTVARHKNTSCQYMEDMYCDNNYINMTPTRCSVLITSESGDEQIIMKEAYGPYEGRAEQH